MAGKSGGEGFGGIVISAGGLVEGGRSESIDLIAQEYRNLMKTHFPGWSESSIGNSLVNHINTVAAISAENSGVIPGTERDIILTATEAGIRNIPAVVGSFTQEVGSDRETESPELLVNVLARLQFLLVDFNDTYSEAHINKDTNEEEPFAQATDRFLKGMGLYKQLAEVFVPSQEPDNDGSEVDDEKFEMSLSLSNNLETIIEQLKEEVEDLFGDYERSSAIRGAIVQVIMNYGACVELMHIPDESARDYVYKSLRGDSSQNQDARLAALGVDFSQLPGYLGGENYGYLYFGSPLPAYALIEAVSRGVFTGDEAGSVLDSILNAYKNVPLLHTYLDGLADYGLEEENNTPNLYKIIGEDIDLIEEFLKAPVGSDNLLAKAVVRDLITFYQLELARNLQKGDNVDGEKRKGILERLLGSLSANPS